MSKPKFVSLKQIAGALEVSERTIRRKADHLGIEKARDKVFKNRFFAIVLEKELAQRGYQVNF